MLLVEGKCSIIFFSLCVKANNNLPGTIFTPMQLSPKQTMFYNRLTKVYKHRSKQAKKRSISCYRVYENDLPEFPVCIELYGDSIYLSEYKRSHGLSDEAYNLWFDEMVTVVLLVFEKEEHQLFIKQRKRMHHRSQQYEKTAHAKEFFMVQENGLNFLVNLTDYLDTGLFLDHRLTRKMVYDKAAGKRVLNLFCYTGSFSVYAAKAGATKVTSVDMSKTYLDWATQNFEINDLPTNNHAFIHANVLEFLQEQKPNSYDIIVLDPPTFSNSKRMDDFFEIQRDHVQLINNCLYCLSNEGLLYFSTNYTKFILDEENINSSPIKNITKATTDFDFEGKLKRWCYVITK